MEIYTDILASCRESNAKLVAVSKTKPVEQIKALYDKGQRIFGENKVQELVEKQALLPKDINWHLIGHLQSNKVKYIASFVDLIHAVDSIKLLKEINKQAKKYDRTIDVLLQIKIAKEESKFGIDPKELNTFLDEIQQLSLENIRIKGLMGMATFTDNQAQVEDEFKLLKRLFDPLKNTDLIDKEAFNEISMGMSGDYKLALETGSTMIRIGSLLFGSRDYPK
jgi:pyridoxal phosphate enzyme (YggS family)